MSVYRVSNPRQSWYGESIGILILDANYPCVPGNVGNASTFPFPVRYKVVKDASIDRLLNQRDTTLLKPFVDAAKALREEGVKAITGACGFMALFQKEVVQALDIPVFLSSLLQIPFIHNTLNSSQKIGLITADKTALTPRHFASVGIDEKIPLVIAGMEDQPEFSSAVLKEKGTLDSTLIQQEVVTVAKTLVEAHPEVGALLLECSDLPPYARAVQEAVGRPVFDFFTMIHYVHTAVVRNYFHGFM
jgi:aspartate/glutamate racemase